MCAPLANTDKNVAVGRICLPRQRWRSRGEWYFWNITYISISRYIYILVLILFKFVLQLFDLRFDPIWGKYVYKPNINFLDMTPANFFSSIRKTVYQPLNRNEITTTRFWGKTSMFTKLQKSDINVHNVKTPNSHFTLSSFLIFMLYVSEPLYYHTIYYYSHTTLFYLKLR